MTKESTIELQKIDCSCNDCKYLFRFLEKQNIVLQNDKDTQRETFYLVKAKKIKETIENIASLTKHREVIKNVDSKIEKQKNRLKLFEQSEHSYQGQKFPIQYGVCCKFQKQVTFLGNTFSLETQDCFEHRRN